MKSTVRKAGKNVKILVLNGSPRGAQSNTIKITNAFLEGFLSQGAHDVTTLEVRSKKIGHCLGCFACWKDTPGVCVIDDDMTEILSLLIKADLVIWSFPLYYFSMPSKIKALMDRMLPLNLPFIDADTAGNPTHPSRYDLSHQRTILISTCGFYSTENNYEALDAQFDIAFGKSSVTKILCPQGELFSQGQLRTRTDDYLSHVRTAGSEYAKNGTISELTQRELSRLLYSPETFMTLANASWGVERETEKSQTNTTAKKIVEKSSNAPLPFLIQMAALYNPQVLAGKEAILEFYFTDLDLTQRMHLGKTSCTFLPTDSDEQAAQREHPRDISTTRIETALSVWQEIGAGKIDGATAMMEGKYRVLGIFDLMLKMDDLFAGPELSETATKAISKTSEAAHKKRNMALVILPWIPLWIALPINLTAGLIASLAGLVLFQLSGFKWKIGTHERIAFAGVTLFTLAIATNIPSQILIPLSYIAFGAHWLISCFFTVPLTAVYSSAGYGGDGAFRNPLFMKTNRIITIVWGILYLATGIWTWFLLTTPVAPLTGAINNITPALCGLWTAWFSKWYPAKVARGN